MTVDVELEILLSLRFLDQVAFLLKLFEFYFDANLIRMHRPQYLNIAAVEFTVQKLRNLDTGQRISPPYSLVILLSVIIRVITLVDFCQRLVTACTHCHSLSLLLLLQMS